jgi:hypothetical protein
MVEVRYGYFWARRVSFLLLSSRCGSSQFSTAMDIYGASPQGYVVSRSSTQFDAVKYFDKLTRFSLYLLDAHLVFDGYISNVTNEIEQMEPLRQSMWPK